QKQKKLIMLPSEIMIWQPEFTDKILSRKPGAVQHIADSGIYLSLSFAFRIPFAITAVSLIADIAAENSTITLHTLLVVGDIQIIQISCCWGITGTTSPDVVKSRHTTRKRTAR
ncbi:hypothetical protein NEQ00_24850, partial [Escherichia coli]|nr:hypothetical protein [Escherichia coli]MDI1063952.1 hypothetical protein [Escherichia coli]MDI1172847.1 hypothetical protein [Escherichia coli]